MKYEIFQLADLDVRKLKLIKENVCWYGDRDHSRWMFKSTDKRNLYFKIWNPTFIRRDNILTGIDIGFYDERTTPALSGPIFHRGICRGYVMRKCIKNWNLKLDEEFYGLIKKRSVETKYFHCQFSPYHMMRYRGGYTLIGLEGLYPFSIMQKAQFAYKDYETFIARLSNQHVDQYQLRSTPYFGRSPLLVRGARFLWSNARSLLSEKKMNRVHLIER